MLTERNNSILDHIPDWAQRQRWVDLAWIADNLPNFYSAASIAYESVGRGAVVVDTTIVETTYHTPDGGHPAAYLTQSEVARYEDAAIDCLIAGYLPDEELVVVLLKEAHRTSAYRVRGHFPEGTSPFGSSTKQPLDPTVYTDPIYGGT